MLLSLVGLGIVFAQRGGGGSDAAGGALGLGMVCFCYLFAFLVLGLPQIIGIWKAFEKAGEPGWASLIPIYNMMVMAKIGGRPEVHGLLVLIPCIGWIFGIMILMDFAKAYGKDPIYGLGLAFLGIIFWPMLGFGSAQYVGVGGGREDVTRPRRRGRDDEDDYEDEPRPRRRRVEDEDED